ncbi:hypothetical protein HZ326_29052 [Fusarium oxysporum f. sp. albedinis]|nr:hypothetical protein HZ326_29052 [Fusarium oxysporum f. sp. albedinis]
MRGEIIKDDRDDNETGKLSQYLVATFNLGFLVGLKPQTEIEWSLELELMRPGEGLPSEVTEMLPQFYNENAGLLTGLFSYSATRSRLFRPQRALKLNINRIVFSGPH